MAIDEYVFGSYKDEATNLIGSLEDAHRLLGLFSSSSYEYEIIYCCYGPEEARTIAAEGIDTEERGYDVALLQGDGWSIVDDFAQGAWACSFRKGLNEFGLFVRREDAEAYLRKYRSHREADSDMDFVVTFVTRVTVRSGSAIKDRGRRQLQLAK